MTDTHDTPEAVEALVAAINVHEARFGYGPHDEECAAAILASMPDMVLTPRVATADWTGSSRKDAEIARLRAALDEVYDKAPGPWLALTLSETTQAVLAETGRQRSGKGRVTSTRLDQRLKANRNRAALAPSEPERIEP